MEKFTADIRARAAHVPSAPPQADLSSKVAYSLGDLQKMGFGGRAYIYTQIQSDRLRATKRGRYTIVLAPDLQAWVASLPAIKPRTAA
jgi:hypothetical protein